MSTTPLFVGFRGAGLFRDLSINSWEEVQKSGKIDALRKFLKSPEILPWYYAPTGDISAAFRLGEILNMSSINVSVSPRHRISQQQLADDNVVFVGSPRAFGDQLRGLPIQLEFVMVVAKLRKSGGEIPRYFQVVLDVRFTDGVPTEVSYVMHRDLKPKGRQVFPR